MLSSLRYFWKHIPLSFSFAILQADCCPGLLLSTDVKEKIKLDTRGLYVSKLLSLCSTRVKFAMYLKKEKGFGVGILIWGGIAF